MKRGREVFYTLLAAFAIISFWRGVWGLMDIYLFPNNYTESLLVSIVIGVATIYSIEGMWKKVI